MKSHQDLDLWKGSLDLVLKTYSATMTFPREEIFGLRSQMRRAAVSIPSNISEGAARNQKKDFIRFLRISIGSLAELETQNIIAYRLQYTSDELYQAISSLIYKTRSQICGLIKSLERPPIGTYPKVTDNT